MTAAQEEPGRAADAAGSGAGGRAKDAGRARRAGGAAAGDAHPRGRAAGAAGGAAEPDGHAAKPDGGATGAAGRPESQIAEQQSQLSQQQRQIEDLVGVRTQIIADLSSALREANISATVDPASGAIALASDVLFATGESQLTDEGRSRIDAFLPVYLDVLFSDEYRGYISEIIIEGHTDSVGSYISNLLLSQQRRLQRGQLCARRRLPLHLRRNA